MAYDRMVILSDVGHSITCKAAGTISGGDLVQWNSGADVVGSVATTYAAGDIAINTYSGALVATTINNNVIGVASQTVLSGGFVDVLMQGIFVFPAGSNGISGGQPVSAAGYANCMEIENGSYAVALIGKRLQIGRALSNATANTGFAIVRLDV